jgi:hypothetical protein
MNLERFCFLLGIPLTEDFSELSSAFRRYAKNHHPDVGGNREKWNEISQLHVQTKKLHSEGKPVRQSSEQRERSKSSPKSESARSRSKSNANSRPRVKQGENVYLRRRINIDSLINGCQINISLPDESFRSKREAQYTQITLKIEPNPLVFNMDGSISKRYLNSIFSYKKVVPGRGKESDSGGLPGNLIIEFDVITSGFNIFEHIKNSDFGFQNERSSNVPPPPHPRSQKSWKTLVASFLIIAGFGYAIHAQNVENAQEEIAYELCSYVQSVHTSIVDNFFYGSQSPWSDALNNGFFSPDPEAPNQTGFQGYADELPSYYQTLNNELNLARYLDLKSLIVEFISRVESNSTSYGRYIVKAYKECSRLEKEFFYND